MSHLSTKRLNNILKMRNVIRRSQLRRERRKERLLWLRESKKLLRLVKDKNLKELKHRLNVSRSGRKLS